MSNDLKQLWIIVGMLALAIVLMSIATGFHIGNVENDIKKLHEEIRSCK